MRLYHGTCTSFLPGILKEGLKPNSGFAFAEEMENSAPKHDVDNAIYLTSKLSTAKHFAWFRARYERAKYGAKLYFGIDAAWCALPEHNGKCWGRFKYSHIVHSDAKPVVLVFDVPDSIQGELHEDEQSPDYSKAYWSNRTLSPATIVRVMRIKEQPIVDPNTVPDDVNI